jgi:glutamyl-tRNA(Gln) amidotransferase subunit D
MHTSARDAFVTINEAPIGKVYYDSDPQKVHLSILSHYNYTKRGEKELKLRDQLEEKCCLIKFYPGEPPSVFDFFVKQGYKGIVLEGTGLGHVAAEWVPSVENAVKNGIPVVMTSQCIYGRICDRVYDTGRDLLRAGVIEGGDMLPETALVKLMWILGKTADMKPEIEMEEIRRLMQKNIVGELSERSDEKHQRK